jgi:hypothetical protein
VRCDGLNGDNALDHIFRQISLAVN